MHAVLLDKKTFLPNLDFSAIANEVDTLTSFETTSAAELVSRAINAEIIITNKVVIDKDVIAQLPKLKLICIAATGMNNVDITAANLTGIKVTNVSDYAKYSVAQYIYSQLLAQLNHPDHYANNTRQGLWQKSPVFCNVDKPFYQLAGKTFGIIGNGAIGQTVATIAQALGMKILLSERINASTIRQGRVSFDECIANSDVISLHCPLTPETKHIINAENINKMKTGVVLINTARGDLIDDSALLDAVNNNHIKLAILDVLNQEPPSADHLLIKANHKNIVITAHIAWASVEAQQQLIQGVADNIKRFASK